MKFESIKNFILVDLLSNPEKLQITLGTSELRTLLILQLLSVVVKRERGKSRSKGETDRLLRVILNYVVHRVLLQK